jgi:hypothetical protein
MRDIVHDVYLRFDIYPISKIQSLRTESSPLSSQLLWNHPDCLKPTAQLPAEVQVASLALIYLECEQDFNLKAVVPKE